MSSFISYRSSLLAVVQTAAPNNSNKNTHPNPPLRIEYTNEHGAKQQLDINPTRVLKIITANESEEISTLGFIQSKKASLAKSTGWSGLATREIAKEGVLGHVSKSLGGLHDTNTRLKAVERHFLAFVKLKEMVTEKQKGRLTLTARACHRDESRFDLVYQMDGQDIFIEETVSVESFLKLDKIATFENSTGEMTTCLNFEAALATLSAIPRKSSYYPDPRLAATSDATSAETLLTREEIEKK